MKKRLVAALLISAVLLTACQGKAEKEDATGAANATETDAGTVAGVEENAGNAKADGAETDAVVTADKTDEAGSDAAAETEQQPPLNIIDDKYRTTYEIFVYSFADSDGDGIGDLKGVTDKLDYINDGDDATDTDLGCNQIWLMPIMPSPTYHKYDVTDYMNIDPEYGTLEDFDNLVKACHERGIKVIIDMVLNHSSSEHPWFKAAKEYLKSHNDLESLYTGSGAPKAEIQRECPYVYYYNFTKENQTGYEKVNGTDWYYEARFWSGMPDLNLDSEAVFNEITDITKFWTDRGVDGYRLDAVAYYYTNNDAKNIEFMTRFNDMVKSQNENAYIVGEAWTAQSTYAEYYTSGIDSFFDFDFSGSEGLIASVARGKKAPSLLIKAMASEENLYASKNPDYVNAPFYTNHDMARSAGYFVGKGSQNMTKMAGALNLLMGGNAFIYYGEELGMKGSGKDENKRAPMQWTSAESGTVDGAILCDGPKDMDKFDMIYPPLDEQEKDTYSIYNYYKKAIRLRNTYPVIARGMTLPVEGLDQDRLGAFVKYITPTGSESTADMLILGKEDETYGPTALLFLINNGSEAQAIDLSSCTVVSDSMRLDSQYTPQLAYQLNVGEEKAELNGTTLTIPSYSIVAIK